MEGRTICVFADASAWPIQSYIQKFRPEFEEHIRKGAASEPNINRTKFAGDTLNAENQSVNMSPANLVRKVHV